jgi:uncharacterized repeat protein (TIGR01451 family)
LKLTGSVSNPSAVLGDTITFTLRLTNNGPQTAESILVDAILPSGLTLDSASPATGSFDSDTSEWSISTLNSGDCATLEVTATVTEVGSATFLAEVKSATQLDPDSTPGNHNAAEDDQVRIDLRDYATTYTEDDPPVALVDSDATLVDVESNIASLTITLTNPLDGSAETLAADVDGTSIAASYDSTTGVLSLVGPDTAESFEQVLRTITYVNSSQNPDETARTITFEVVDVDGHVGDVVTTTVSVIAVNDPPAVTTNQGLTLDEGATAILAQGDLEATDPEQASEDLVYTIDPSGGPFNGVLENVGNPGTSISVFTQVDINNGDIVYIHNGSETTNDTIMFVVADGVGGSSDLTTLNVTISPANDAPVNSVPGNLTVLEDTDLVLSTANGNAIQIADIDAAPGTVGARLTTTNGALTLSSTFGLTIATGTGTNDRDIVIAGSLEDLNAALNGLVFSPNADFNGIATINIQTRDFGNSGHGGELIDNDSVTINVVPVNDAPESQDDAYATDEDTNLTVLPLFGVLGNDSDRDLDLLQAVLLTAPTDGAFTLNGDGSFDYQPDPNFHGTTSFSYHATDGILTSPTVTVTLTINPVNDVTVPTSDTYEVNQSDSLVVDPDGVLSNDIDVDGDTLTASLTDLPDNGTIEFNSDGSFTYTPNLIFFGTDSFTYVPDDGTEPGAPTIVTLVVNQTVFRFPTDPTDDSPAEESAPDDDILPVDSIPTDGQVTVPGLPPKTPTGDGDRDLLEPTPSPQPEPTVVIATASSPEVFIGSPSISISRPELPPEPRDLGTGDIELISTSPVVFDDEPFNTDIMWQNLDALSSELELHEATRDLEVHFSVGATAVVGTSLTVGYVAWLLRGGSFLMAMVSSLPAWTRIDPLPILESAGALTNDEDDESLSQMLQKSKTSKALKKQQTHTSPRP